MNLHRSPVLIELIPGSRKLYLAFGGMQGALGMPPFEFYRSSNILNESRIFFRDLTQTWYHAGLPGLTRDIPETTQYIRSLIDHAAPEEVIFVGNSMGGFAAILFSCLVGYGTAIGFSPQTYIAWSKRRSTGDRRWRSCVLRTYRATLFRPRFFDLRRLLQNSGAVNRVEIFVSSLDELDLIHARNLAGFDNVRITVRDFGGHNLVKHLRDTGELQRILQGVHSDQTQPSSSLSSFSVRL
jgi:pimeloyl-ACP methyl ester carboxylesterase